jgi:hypothetical protein
MKNEKAKQIIITADYEEIKHISLSDILAFRVKNGVYKIILKQSQQQSQQLNEGVATC